ncbi:MAG: dTDP-glucose 4,6-dehydratase [Paraglaciecola sp.]|jgi:dTDP-glucose 4,6-dehydratase
MVIPNEKNWVLKDKGSMNILGTGASKFISLAVVRHIIQDSDVSVMNIDKLTCADTLGSVASIPASKR